MTISQHVMERTTTTGHSGQLPDTVGNNFHESAHFVPISPSALQERRLTIALSDRCCAYE